MGIDLELVNRVKGFLDHGEGMRLYEIAREAAGLGPCLEIGSYCGKSSVYLGSGCREGKGILFSIDHHRGSEEQQPGEEYFDPDLMDPRTLEMDTFPHFRNALKLTGLEETVVPLVSRSDVAGRAWATPLSLVFIDGGHAYETVVTDYRVWAPHLLPGGYLLIHDIFEDPKEGGLAPYRVYQAAVGSGDYEARPRFKTLGILQRRSPRPPDSRRQDPMG